MSAPPLRADFYVELVVERRILSTGEPVSIKAHKLTQRRPENATGVVVKLTVELPRAAFMPLQPAATISIPAKHADTSIAARSLYIEPEPDGGEHVDAAP